MFKSHRMPAWVKSEVECPKSMIASGETAASSTTRLNISETVMNVQ